MAVVCPRCGEENPEQARYCMACTEPLIAAAPAREERKVVSVLFVDLVGFTAASEAADPEDVRARLQRYHARAKAQVERFGGTIEKFVGDAVMAVFGAPVAHEDDAERAVRAGLAILEAMEELELEARGAVNTGEAVEYEELEPVDAKGKSEPVAAWRALRARSRFGVDLEPSRATPFVGRDDELEVLRQVYARALR